MDKPSLKDIMQSIPARFRQEKSEGYETVFHFIISGDEGAQYTVIIKNGQCQLLEELISEPKCIVKTKASTYVKLELGEINPQMALMTGKVKVSNIAEMIRFSKLFRRYAPNKAETKIESRKPQHGPLKGLRIIDFTRLLPGPLATMMMADMGAEVIKVEDPDSPDYIRSFAPQIENDSAFYLSLNRSKRSLALNYSSAKGREIIYKLAQTADIFIEQFRPSVMNNMSLGYADIKKVNSNIIYVSITGYGQDGPYANKAGHDLNYIGYSGLLGTTGKKNSGPVIPGGQVADVTGGAYMTMNACLSALYAREKTGVGQHVDVSMLDCVIPVNTLQIAQYYATQQNPLRDELPLSGGAANYNVYECADQKYIALGTLEPKFWEPFCDLVNKPEWKSRILDTGDQMRQLKDQVTGLFKTKTQHEWLELTTSLNNCISPVLDIQDLENDPQIKHRNMIMPGKGSMKNIGIPLKFSKTSAQVSWESPRLGEDTHAILKELNLSESEIEELQG